MLVVMLTLTLFSDPLTVLGRRQYRTCTPRNIYETVFRHGDGVEMRQGRSGGRGGGGGEGWVFI